MKALLIFLSLCVISTVVTAQTCSLCTYAIAYIDSLLAQNATQQEIEQELDQACFDNAQCIQIINSNLPQVITWLENDFTPQQVCTYLGLCSSMEKELKKAQTKQSFGCEACTFIVDEIYSYIQQNYTEQEIMAAADQLCFGDSQCVAFINSNLPAIIQYLINGVSAQQACQDLGVCTSMVKVAAQVQVAIEAKEKKLNVKNGQGVSCSICVYAVSYIENWLQQNNSVNEIETILDEACFGQSSCISLINNNLPNLIAYLEQQYPPQKCCVALGSCSQEKEVPKVETPVKKTSSRFNLHRVKNVSKH